VLQGGRGAGRGGEGEVGTREEGDKVRYLHTVHVKKLPKDLLDSLIKI
jgi:hypothetical protein